VHKRAAAAARDNSEGIIERIEMVTRKTQENNEKKKKELQANVRVQVND
jgi:hypothetical protein